MSPITSENDVVEFYAAFTRGDFEFMSERLHPECVLEFPGSSFGGTVRGRDAIIDMFRGIQAGFAGTLRFHCEWAFFTGEFAGVHWYTNGQPAQGGEYVNCGVAWYRLKDGLIHVFKDFLDTEVVAAFWPDGQPATDLEPAHKAVERLVSNTGRDFRQPHQQPVAVAGRRGT